MKRFYCLPGLSKSTLNRRLRRLAAEQDCVMDRDKMIRECRHHGDRCEIHEVRIIGFRETYTEADNMQRIASAGCDSASTEATVLTSNRPRRKSKKPRRFLSTDLDSETSESDEMPQLECSFGDHSASHNIPTAFLPSTPPLPIHRKSTEKRLSFSENTPPGATAADCATIRSPLSSSPYNRDPPPVRFRELVDSPGIRPLTSPTTTSIDERLDFVVQTVRQLSIRLKRIECKLDFLTAERRKRHAEDVEVAVSCKEFSLPLASEAELMRLEAKLQDTDTRSKLIRLLSTYGGRSCGEAVRHILTKVISAAFAPQCNLLGMHGKTAIANKLIYMVMRDAVRVDSRFGTMTDTEYNIVVREWLHNARLRKSLRANKGHVRTSVIILEAQPEVPSTSGNM